MNSKYSETSPTVTPNQETSETISELVRRHILDKNHTTTDEELRNAKIELSDIAGSNTTNLYKIKSSVIDKD